VDGWVDPCFGEGVGVKSVTKIAICNQKIYWYTDDDNLNYETNGNSSELSLPGITAQALITTSSVVLVKCLIIHINYCFTPEKSKHTAKYYFQVIPKKAIQHF
jgi:hypothetical protein